MLKELARIAPTGVIIGAAVVLLYMFPPGTSESQEHNFTRMQGLEEKNERLLRELTQKEIELQRINTQAITLEAAQDSMPVPIWIKDRAGNFLFVNVPYEQKFLSHLGHSQASVLNTHQSDIFPPHIAQEYAENDAEILATGQVFDDRETWVNADGEEERGRFIKYPISIGSVRFGTGGFYVPEEDVTR